MFFCIQSSRTYSFLRIHITTILKNTRKRNTDTTSHEINLRFQIVIKLYLPSHNNLTFLNSLKQILNIRILFKSLSCLIHISCNFNSISDCRYCYFIFNCSHKMFYQPSKHILPGMKFTFSLYLRKFSFFLCH